MNTHTHSAKAKRKDEQQRATCYCFSFVHSLRRSVRSSLFQSVFAGSFQCSKRNATQGLQRTSSAAAVSSFAQQVVGCCWLLKRLRRCRSQLPSFGRSCSCCRVYFLLLLCCLKKRHSRRVQKPANRPLSPAKRRPTCGK